MIAMAWGVGAMATTESPQESSALLAEIRLMRQSIDSMAANYLRVQVLFGRIQLQQLPLGRAAAMLQSAKTQLASVEVRYQDLQDRISQLDAMATAPGRAPDDTDSLQREARTVRAEATRLENQRSSLLAAEAEAARQHAEEQAKMDALNAQIEELGRMLLPPPRP
jgi:chromosome segregation ATPase